MNYIYFSYGMALASSLWGVASILEDAKVPGVIMLITSSLVWINILLQLVMDKYRKNSKEEKNG